VLGGFVKQIVWSTFAVIAVLLGFRLVSPAPADPTYHIAYLLDRSTHFESEHLRPENLFKGVSGYTVDVVYSWQELMRAQTKQPLDILVLHDSALRMVDFEWMAAAYWSGMTISGINIRPTMLAHLFDDACLLYGQEMALPEEPPYFTMTTRLILSVQDRTQTTKWFRRDWHRNCNYFWPPEVKEAATVGGFYAAGPMLEKESLEFFQFLLVENMDWRQAAIERFTEEHKRGIFTETWVAQ
jgi:hypothetical protein